MVTVSKVDLGVVIAQEQMRDVVAVVDDLAEILLIGCLHGRRRRADEVDHASSPAY
jgi:hypothetical protein